MNDQVSIHIDAPPEQVYRLISDVPRMGEWSPECYQCEWLNSPANPGTATVGARFNAKNRKGHLRWSNQPEVIAAEPGREFAFRRTAPGAGEVIWRYRMTARDDGTDLTESYEILRPASAPVRLMIRLLARVPDRPADLHQAMTTTLTRLKEAAETASK